MSKPLSLMFPSLQTFDELAGIETMPTIAIWLRRVIFFFLILMVLAAPHSIAATQIAWLTGMFLWIVSLFFKPLPKFKFGKLDIALWAFFGWSVITAIFSYAPDISLDKLRTPALFLIFYFVYYNARTRRAAHFLAFALIASCMVNVLRTPIERIIGRGVEIHGVRSESPLAKALLLDGDALLEANGRKLNAPADLVAELQNAGHAKVKFYRPDFEFIVDVKAENLLSGTSDAEKLGIGSWNRSHNWRSMGFYGHYVTYAEVLQLIASLAFGLLLAAAGRNPLVSKGLTFTSDDKPLLTRSLRQPLGLLLFSFLAMCLALLLTVTRASQLGLVVSAFASVFALGKRKLLLGLAAILLPIAIGALLFLQQSRRVGFLDLTDASTSYRITMVRDGIRLWSDSPRNFVFGVGMDSIKRYWREWQLFDGGRLPIGHFHSTPLQLAVERGLPALLLWLAILAIYARSLWRGIKNASDWKSLGIMLGCFGGAAGFFVSGLVHYNLGDAEAAMIFFLLMGLGIRSGRNET